MVMIENSQVRVLVADDNEINQYVIREILETDGYLVDTVCDGDHIIPTMESNHYDLIIMDCLMPVMDGFTATKAIRISDTGSFDPDIPILAVTALSDPEDPSQCLESGMDDYISKPVVPSELLRRVSRLLNDAGKPGLAQIRKQNQQGPKNFDFSNIIETLSKTIVRDIQGWQYEMEAWLNSGSFKELGALAHKIRGTADVLGDSILSNYCLSLEASVKAGNTDQLAGLTEIIVTQLKELGGALRSRS